MKNILLLVLLLLVQFVNSQSISDINFGTDETFEVVTWNIEWFPKDGYTTVNYVKEILNALDADVIAVQEIDDKTTFRQIGADMANYNCFIPDGDYSSLGYFYNVNHVELLDYYQIYTTSSYWNTFPRAPLVMELNAQGEKFYIINNHLKCCGDGDLDLGNTSDEEYRRYMAANLIKQYIDNNLSNKNVIVVGDFNDEITDNDADNIFHNILTDADNYTFADMEIATGSSENFSYPSWPSHLDHILITNELFDDFNRQESYIETQKIDEYMGGWWNYDSHVSDHRPVGLKLKMKTSDVKSKPTDNWFAIYPNPGKGETRIIVNKPADFSDIKVFNMQGQLVSRIALDAKTKVNHYVKLQLNPGLYMVCFENNGQIFESKRLIIN